jgi:hypothetical protein
MPFEGMLTCPMCGGRFRVGIPGQQRPTVHDVFEVVCPINASRIRFLAVTSEEAEKAGRVGVEGLQEVAVLGGHAPAVPVSGRR